MQDIEHAVDGARSQLRILQHPAQPAQDHPWEVAGKISRVEGLHPRTEVAGGETVLPLTLYFLTDRVVCAPAGSRCLQQRAEDHLRSPHPLVARNIQDPPLPRGSPHFSTRKGHGLAQLALQRAIPKQQKTAKSKKLMIHFLYD